MTMFSNTIKTKFYYCIFHPSIIQHASASSMHHFMITSLQSISGDLATIVYLADRHLFIAESCIKTCLHV